MDSQYRRRRNMVGQNPSLALITSELLNLEYELGKMDCFLLVVEYLRRINIPLPTEFEGHTEANYTELYRKDPQEAKEAMVRFLDSMFPLVSAKSVVAGDVMLLKLKGRGQLPFLAINGGNGNGIFMIEDKGVVVTTLRHYLILRSWKCQEQLYLS